MNLDAIAEKLYKELHTPWLGDKAVIRAALAQVRDDALEEGAKAAFTFANTEDEHRILKRFAAKLRAMKEPT